MQSAIGTLFWLRARAPDVDNANLPSGMDPTPAHAPVRVRGANVTLAPDCVTVVLAGQSNDPPSLFKVIVAAPE